MMEMEKPKITCEETDNGNFARFVVEPLEKGYGITLGNCMRRTLLSSLPGSAVIAVRIAGVPHEFSTIRGVTEDVVDIVLNLKSLALRCTNTDRDFVTYLRIRKQGAGEITANDFEPNDQVEILNPDLHICTMAEGAVLDMDLMIGNGRGYVSNAVNKSKFEDIDYIAIDSIFSPVKKVNFNVESTRVGQSVDFDKLTLEVETNGTTSAREIVSLSAKIINEHINLFVELCEQMGSMEILVSKEEDKQVKLMELPIEEMDLSVRSYNCLKRAGINTIEDLVKKSKSDMLKVRNLGLKSIEEVILKLESYGLSLRREEE
ncbi:MAG: DNA-directed RNA polymerase subunit alpha [Candidatus Gastranaerophilales bacterium]|nr:DNA-directed RNA polymerase subunit alpha [Clostridia bacterium]MBQ8886700.1 DNA-directed RNA polymerase subunit alpha [Candidatus Gastranaerophilales bacterium]